MFDVCNICNLLQARLSEPGLTYLLTLLSRIPEILGEGVMFGSGVVPRGVFSCLQAGGGRVVTEEVGTVILCHVILYLMFYSGVDVLGEQGASRAGLADHQLQTVCQQTGTATRLCHDMSQVVLCHVQSLSSHSL